MALSVSRRRALVRMMGLCAASSVGGSAAAATLDDVRRQILDLKADTAGLAAMRSDREFAFREYGPSDEELRARPSLPRRYSSDKEIAQPAVDLIVTCEVTSRKHYESTLKSPTWPGGLSGVTIGIGYDLGYQSKDDFARDWADLLSPQKIDSLGAACLIKAESAKNLGGFLQDVSIDWQPANTQFGRFLKLVAGQTIQAFPDSATLSALSFGALVSLIYNRGGQLRPSANDPNDRRREMRTIRELLAANRASEVPEQLRQMKRLWPVGQAGLLRRREAEAVMFEVGLGR